MKRVVMIMTMCLGFISFHSDAQVRVNNNRQEQPSWGLHDKQYVSYYYLPEIETYYYVPEKQFIYKDKGRWVSAPLLPGRYRNTDLRKTPKLVINDAKPYERHGYYSSLYQNRNNGDRAMIYNVRNRELRNRTIMNSNYDRNDEWREGRDYKRNKKEKRNRGHGHAYGHNKR